jgi:hypothetical protein
MFLSFEPDPPLLYGVSRVSAPRTEGNKFALKSGGRYRSLGEFELIFRMAKCGAGRKAIAQKCAACVKDRRKVETMVSTVLLTISANISAQARTLARDVRTWERRAIRVRNPH